ncbi:PucR family transcriptional regulator [Rhodococcus sp. D2-41]|uniref:Helix-turn-helix domain-containing protein n=1 Tax=Speluncibacter jeojiensis TaxID=2710754 RepID=A0A9X4RF19_9ACTN|nr:helix-turn-helix domain-containing protein [Rhodococcus sp. D2-41]MDG3009456.1 PucR family transcriptional regulator [Rhodococcus sp. D2-41]MDG3016384.1 helix-turn-helix domain-containing protein [Corynebacteriales bacterium D3-21]
MSGDGPVPRSALAILDRVYKRFDAVARAGAVGPSAGHLPVGIREQEVPATVRHYLALVVRSLREHEPLREPDLKGARSRGAQRAAEGVPLSLVLHNWHYGGRMFLQACGEEAGEADVEGLRYLMLGYFDLHEVMVRAVVDSYQAEMAVISSEDRGADHLLARLLLSGQNATEEAERFGVRLARRYAVLAVAFAELADERGDDATRRAVAGRRKLRQVHRVLVGGGTEQVLALLEPEGGQILIPWDGESPRRAAQVAAALIDRIGAAAGVAVTAGLVGYAETDSLPASSALAQDILDLAVAERSPAGLYRIEDVALSYQLTRRTAGSDHLLMILAPLEPHPELLETLESYYAHNLDRAPTARDLHVHPNTVNNRINRIEELLGMDPNDVTSIMRLGAALEIRRAAHHLAD